MTTYVEVGLIRLRGKSRMIFRFLAYQPKFSSVQSLSCVRLFMTPWTAAHQASLFTQTHVHRVDDAIQPSHPLSSPSPPALNLSQHQGLFKWVISSHQVAKVLEFQLQHQSFPDDRHRNQIDYILCSQRWKSSIQSAKTRPGADCGSDHELLIAKFRLKLKKVEKTTRPFRYDLNQIPNAYSGSEK